MVGLGDLGGGTFGSVAYDISADGSVVVGYGNSASRIEAFRWTQTGGMIGLGDLPGGDFFSTAFAISADGAIVVGQGHSALGYEAFFWDSAHGMRSLKDLLIDEFGLGATLAGWTLTSANDISADGQFIVGSGTNPSGNTEAWLARLAAVAPVPGDFNHDGTVDAADYVVWRKGLGTIYTQDDYNTWRAHFGQTAGSGATLRSVEPLSAVIPEPATLLLLLMAVVVIFTLRRAIVS
ncbi:MAG: PEP-CTERM sorting domain-containing protein [Pirellulales bacterium]